MLQWRENQTRSESHVLHHVSHFLLEIWQHSVQTLSFSTHWIKSTVTSADIKAGCQRETHLTLPLHPADLLLHQQLQEPLRAEGLGASLPARQDPNRVPLTRRHVATGWPQLIGCSLPLLPVRRHAASRLKEKSSYREWVLTRRSHDGSPRFLKAENMVKRNQSKGENVTLQQVTDCRKWTDSGSDKAESKIVCQPAICVRKPANPA